MLNSNMWGKITLKNNFELCKWTDIFCPKKFSEKHK